MLMFLCRVAVRLYYINNITSWGGFSTGNRIILFDFFKV